MKQITYHYRGLIEVGTGRPGYRWTEGYSEDINGNMSAPWMTRRQCQEDAKREGSKAVFNAIKQAVCPHY